MFSGPFHLQSLVDLFPAHMREAELLISLLTGRTDREKEESIQAQCGGGAKQARRLVRKESCYMAGELTAQSYIDCGIKNYRYVAVLDLRTSEICRELDGKVFSVKDRKGD